MWRLPSRHADDGHRSSGIPPRPAAHRAPAACVSDESVERLLVARLVKRDEEAFNEVVRQHGDRVFNLVLRMVGSRAEAEDIAQEVFVTVFKSIDSFRSEAKLSTWLLRIATTTPRIASSTWPAAGAGF